MRKRLLFDVTRLAWRARRPSPTGIDRVLLAYADWLERQDQFEVVPVAVAGSGLVTVSEARYQALRRRSGQTPTSGTMDVLRRSLSAGRPEVVRRPAQGASSGDRLPLAADVAWRTVKSALTARPRGGIYLNIAHTGLHRPTLLSGLPDDCLAVVMVHDLIPVLSPQYCAPSSEAKHRARLTHILDRADLVITNSVATREALVQFATERGQRIPPIEAIWLGIEAAFRKRPVRPAACAPYFVSVGTIEARKNLAFLLTLWDRLADVMGQACPQLVLVGRRGWENEAVIDHLERSPSVRRLVHEVCDLTDEDLAEVMAGACGLLAPSLAEGFDLPAVEAMAIGAPVIASDIPAHRELLAGARLIDPLDGPAWMAAIADAAYSRSAAPPYAPPTWESHFSALAARLSAW